MNLRRRRLARTLALAAFGFAALAWAFSIFFVAAVHSPSRPLPGADPTGIRAESACYGTKGAFFATSARPSDYSLDRNAHAVREHRPRIEWWPPDSGIIHVGPMRMGEKSPPVPNTTAVQLHVPLWIPLALALPPLLLTHARDRRPPIRLRRGLCHRCARDLASTPSDSPCPECGTSRLAPTQRPGRLAREQHA